MQGAKQILSSAITSLSRRQKRMLLLALDVILIPAALLFVLLVEPHSTQLDTAEQWGELAAMAGLMMVSGALLASALGLPNVKLNTFEQNAILKSCLFTALVSLVGLMSRAVITPSAMQGSAFIMFWMALTIFAVTSRFVIRHFLRKIYAFSKKRDRVLIYGAGQTGVQLAVALKTDATLDPVAFIDDNSTLQNVIVAGLRVYPPVMVEHLVKEMGIRRVVLAMPSLSRSKLSLIARKLQRQGCDVRMMPSFARLVNDGDLLSSIQPINPGMFLNRPGRQFDRKRIDKTYQNQSILVTGAGGSIGSELCRQVLASNPSRLVLFDVSEAALYQIDRELQAMLEERAPEQRPLVVPIMGSVTDRAALERVMTQNEITVVFHAAAYKHVPLVEKNPIPALRNNVLGTRNVAEVAREVGVKRFVLVSTDKAVRPANVMGATKRMAELSVQDLAERPRDTRFAIVRFGNVLGSSGSVIPLFEEQIRAGGPVTVTHREVTRYFMTIGEASHLVLLAGTYAEGGEVFVLDMGKPVPIVKLATQIIENAGYTVKDEENPDGDIEIEITGLRPGEKLHEELLIGSNVVATENDKILRAREELFSELEMAAALRATEKAIASGQPDEVRALLAKWVTGFADMARISAENVQSSISEHGADR